MLWSLRICCLFDCDVVPSPERKHTCFIHLMETRDSILLRIHLLIHGVYDGTDYNNIFVPDECNLNI